MRNEVIENLISKFLTNNYPIMRIKDNMRFKRAIILDNGKVFFLSDPYAYQQVKTQLTQILVTIFECEVSTIAPILNKKLPSK